MQLELDTANEMAQWMADKLSGGRIEVHDASDVCLAACPFSYPAFHAASDGAVAAYPFNPAIGLADGIPARFAAYDVAGKLRLTGSAGHQDDQPEMAFKTRQIIKDADVIIESFVFSVAPKART